MLTATRSRIASSTKIITHDHTPDTDHHEPSQTLRMDLRTRRSVQQRSTATTALFSTFGFIQTRPGQRKQGYKRLLPGVQDEEARS
jgi:hypothetical protein